MRKPFVLPGIAFLLAVCTALAPSVSAQTLVRDRIQQGSGRSTLAHSIAPRASRATDLGPAPASTPLQSMTLRFKLSDAQNQALATLEAAQQNPSSPQYHQWLTPEQFGAQFGLSSDDLARITAWLSAQGFTNIQTARSRTFVTFAGTVAQANAAFSTSIHNVTADGEKHFANLTEAAVPAAFAPVIGSVTGLNDFRLKSRARTRTVTSPDPQFYSTVSLATYLVPGDIYTIYNTLPLLNSGINGAGVTIAVMGQTDISLTDIAAFRTAAGLAANAPQVKLYGADPGVSSGDLPEASLDVEYSGALAPAATILYVNSTDVIDTSLTQAIDNNLAPIITISYGECEAGLTSSSLASFNQLFRQANVQGQTIVGPGGDSGATDCDDSQSNAPLYAASLGLAVDFPASSPYVTGVGGTMFTDNGTAPNAYFGNANGQYGGSALGYVPEAVWNETSDDGTNGAPGTLAGGGGGASAIFIKPPYQVGTGVPNDFARDVPDVALDAAFVHDAYIYCVSGNCTNGFRNASQGLDTVGGTSVGTPSFAGILALLEQKIQSRIGNANPVIYGLANSTYYSSVFNDVTVGSNAQPCTAGSVNCPNGGSIGFSAGVGYDQATGWGSVNAANLVADWLLVQPAGASVNQGFNTPSVTLAPASPSVTAGTADSVKVTVASATAGLTTVPTGSVQLLIDGTANGSGVALVNGVATLSVPTTGLASGGHNISVVYSGDGTYTGAKGVFTLDVVSVSAADFSITPSTTSLTVNPGATSPGITFTLTPVLGFTGPVQFTVSEPTGALSYSHSFTPPTVNVTSTTPVSTVFTFGAFVPAAKSGTGMLRGGTTQAALRSGPAPWKLAGTGVAMAGIGLLFLPRRRRRWGALLAALLSVGVLTVSGCGDNSAPSNINSAPGTYVLTVTASNGTVTHNATINLTIP